MDLRGGSTENSRIRTHRTIRVLFPNLGHEESCHSSASAAADWVGGPSMEVCESSFVSKVSQSSRGTHLGGSQCPQSPFAPKIQMVSTSSAPLV